MATGWRVTDAVVQDAEGERSEVGEREPNIDHMRVSVPDAVEGQFRNEIIH